MSASSRETFLQPLFLDIRGKPSLVVGGGSTATKRARTLLEAGARVKVVAPEADVALQEMARRGEIVWEKRPFRTEDVEGNFLVVAVTGDRSVNGEVLRACRARGIMVCANAPDSHGDVLFPAVIRRGDLVIAVSTCGGSPALCRMIREDLETNMDELLPETLSLISDVRKKLKNVDIRPAFREWKDALDEEIYKLLEKGMRGEAERLLLERLTGPQPERPELLVWGINHRTACLEARESLSFQGPELESLVRELKRRLGGAVVLFTCNRFEIYVYSRPSELEEAVGAALYPKLEAYREGDHYTPYRLRGTSAIVHLIRVICGLDSMIVGEHQIRNQVKRAVKLAESVGALREPLRGVFQRALHAGRRIASAVQPATEWKSVSGAAVCELRECLGGLQGRSVLVVGSGEAGRTAIRLLKNEGVEKVWVMGRDPNWVLKLADRYDANPASYEELETVLRHVDGVINSSPRPAGLLKRECMERMMGVRSERPLVVVDISVPRGFPDWFSEVNGVLVRDLRDLERWSPGEVEGLRRADELVEREAGRIASWLEERNSFPLIIRLRREAEELGREAAEEIASNLCLGDGAEEYLRQSIGRLVKKIMHHRTEVARHSTCGTVGQE